MLSTLSFCETTVWSSVMVWTCKAEFQGVRVIIKAATSPWLLLQRGGICQHRIWINHLLQLSLKYLTLYFHTHTHTQSWEFSQVSRWALCVWALFFFCPTESCCYWRKISADSWKSRLLTIGNTVNLLWRFITPLGWGFSFSGSGSGYFQNCFSWSFEDYFDLQIELCFNQQKMQMYT